MLPFLFTNTLMLAGMAALGIPVLIHLLLKRKKKKVAFSTIRFFQQHDEQSSRRRKLRNWLLLTLRLLIVSLLVLAFSRPYSRQSQASAGARKLHRVVFVIDRSASMLATGTEGQRWSLAKQRMQKALSDLDENDLVALIECSAHANVLSGFASPASAAQVVRELTPAYGTSTLSDGLSQAVRLLAGAPSGSVSSIDLVSDLQKSSCRGLTACPIPEGIEVKLLAVGDLASPNLAVLSLEAETHEGARPHVTLANFSDEDISSSLQLAADDRPFASQALVLKSGASTNIDFGLPPLKPGWHGLKAVVRLQDSLEADNTRYASLFVPEPAQVLVGEPKASARVFEQATFFVSSALDPGKGSPDSVPGAFALTQVPMERLAGEVASNKKEQPWNVVLLPGLKDLPAGIGKTLASFVQNGGGLVLFLDEGISANRYNKELADLLPARIGTPDQGPGVDSSWRIALYDTNSLAFAAFRSANSGDLRIPEFTKRYTLEVTEGSTRLAFFEDGVPVVVTRAVGRGRVVLVNTSADASWTDWPKHKTFVPFLHGITKYVAQKHGHEETPGAINYLASEDFDLEMGPPGRLTQFVLRTPDGKETKHTSDDQGRLRDLAMSIPGIFSLCDQAGHEVRRLAVNLSAQESNLDALRSNDLLQQLVRVHENPKQTLAAGLFGSHNDQREFWTALLLGALILLMVEPFVANRTSV